MKRKALRVRSEGSIHPYVTEAESRKQHSDSPLCNSLLTLEAIAHTYGKDASISLVSVILERGAKARGDIVDS